MKIYLATVGASMVVAACASPSQLRANLPAAEYRSIKSAKSVALCIVDRWENSGFGGAPSVTFRPTEKGYSVAVRNEDFGSTQLLADVHESETGSVTQYFKGAVLGEGAFDEAVQVCQT